MVPDRADTWTRMVYAGPNKPIAPIDDPYQMFAKLYGRMKDQESLKSILDDLQDDLHKVGRSSASRTAGCWKSTRRSCARWSRSLQDDRRQDVGHAVPELEPGVKHENDNMPKISKMQIDLMVNSFAADFARVATLQFTNSVGGARMSWIGVTEGHHELSHNPDSDLKSQEKLTKINKWYCEQMAYLAKRLAETPEPGGGGSLLDNTTDRLDQRARQGQLAHLERHPLRARRQRSGLPDGPLAQVQEGCPQPPVAGAGPRHGPSHRTLRQPELLR